MTKSLTWTDIERFTTGLDTALRDAEIAPTQLVQCCDADVAYRMIRGFEDLLERGSEVSSQDLLVGCLLAEGFFGRAYLLRPHALEVDAALQRWEHQSAPHRHYLDHLESHLRRYSLDDAVLRDLRAGSERSGFLEKVSGIAVHTFVGLELADGPWQRRLRRLLGAGTGPRVLSFLPVGEESLAQVLGDPDFAVWLRKIHAARDTGARGEPSPSDVADAAAIIMLRGASAARDDRGPHYRFYTETPALRRLWEADPEFRAALTDDRLPPDWSSTAKTLWRTPEHFVVRALFDLHMPLPAQDPPAPRAGLSRNQLREVARQLEHLIEAVQPAERIPFSVDDLPSRPEAAVLWEDLGGKRVVQYIASVRDIAFMDRVWIDFAPSVTGALAATTRQLAGSLSSTLEEFRRLRDAVAEKRDELPGLLRTEVDGLRKRVAGFRQSVDRFWGLRDAVLDLRSAISAELAGLASPSEYPVPRPATDLAVSRWGYRSETLAADIAEWWRRTVVAGREDGYLGATQELARDAERVISGSWPGQDAVFFTALRLWILRQYRPVFLVLGAARGIAPGPSLGIPIEAMRVAARIRSGTAYRGLTPAERREIQGLIRLLQKTGPGLSPEQRGREALAVGYALFHAWLRDAQAAGPAGQATQAKELATASLTLGRDALALLPLETVEYAQALNHCMYVAAECGLEWSVGDRDALEAMVLGSEPDPRWNFRFADTLAVSYLRQAERLVGKLGEDASNVDGAELCRLAREAERWLGLAWPAFGDPDIPIHATAIRAFLKRHCGDL